MKLSSTGILFCALLIGAVSLAANQLPGKKPDKIGRTARREAREREFNEYYGGFIHDTRSQKGKIAIANAQSEIDIKCIDAPLEWLSSEVRTKFEISSQKFSFPKVDSHGDMTIYLISDRFMPSLLIAPEQKWCAVNVLRLKSDKEPFFKARVQKEFMRAFAMLCGSYASSYDNPVMGGISTPEELDNMLNYRLPKDIIKRCSSYLETNGVTPYRRTTFRQACEEGWAPAPTNDVQRAIWERVHSVPKNPMRIEFDPERGL